jgi:hypothetical protein
MQILNAMPQCHWNCLVNILYDEDFNSGKTIDQLCMHCYISGTKQRIMQEHLILNIQVFET